MCDKIIAAAPADKHRAIDKLTDPILRTLAQKLIARNYPEHLTPEMFDEVVGNNSTMIDSQTLDHRGKPHFQAQEALDTIKALQAEQTLDDEQTALLEELEAYVRANFITECDHAVTTYSRL